MQQGAGLTEETPVDRGSASGGGAKFFDEGPVLTHTLVKADLIRYAGAAGDFHPLHTDDAGAQAAGFPGVFAHGMFSAGLLATAITNWFGIGSLVRYRVRFVAQAWPDVTYHSWIFVTERRVENGETLVDFECALLNEEDQPVVTGSGTARVDDFVADSRVVGSDSATSQTASAATSS
jgi:acyl dehydratase